MAPEGSGANLKNGTEAGKMNLCSSVRLYGQERRSFQIRPDGEEEPGAQSQELK